MTRHSSGLVHTSNYRWPATRGLRYHNLKIPLTAPSSQALSHPLTNASQILAWNGGGSSNYSKIVDHTEETVVLDTATPEKAQKVQQFLETEMEEIKSFFDELK